MFFPPSFNSNSEQLIENIYRNARNHTMYVSYQIELDRASYFDAPSNGVKIAMNGSFVNMFLFYPAPDNSGKFGSVAIYGASLNDHKAAVERSMNLFGLLVESVSWDEGYEKFLDVVLDY